MNRVYIREHELADEAAYLEWQTDSLVGRHLNWLPVSSEQAIANFHESLSEQGNPNRERFFYSIVLAATEEVIGSTGFTKVNSNSAECGWFLRQSYWGKGYVTEAVKLLIDNAFNTLLLTKLIASCHKENAASQRVMEKCGFSRVTSEPTKLWYELVK